jgi:hypothetical protein
MIQFGRRRRSWEGVPVEVSGMEKRSREDGARPEESFGRRRRTDGGGRQEEGRLRRKRRANQPGMGAVQRGKSARERPPAAMRARVERKKRVEEEESGIGGKFRSL